VTCGAVDRKHLVAAVIHDFSVVNFHTMTSLQKAILQRVKLLRVYINIFSRNKYQNDNQTTHVKNRNHHTATGNHMPMGSHSMCLPATRKQWLSRLYPSQSWYSIYRPRRDARLSLQGRVTSHRPNGESAVKVVAVQRIHRRIQPN